VRQTITVRLTKELADWLEEEARQTGMSRSRIVREQLERAKAKSPPRAFMRLAGKMKGARDLSSRKGFSHE
jgi:hypothetical protein